jgi:NAD(P)-dependent dehydrogenase (short-subunit alcohol dehydrogenase family)
MALRFASAGARVWINGRRQEALDAVCAQHANIAALAGDVTDEADVEALFAAAGRADIVIANAGQATSNLLKNTEKSEWDRMIGVNLTGAFLTMRAGVRSMGGGPGRIIAISSIAGFRGLAYAAHYTAAKHGVIGLVRATSLEVAPFAITVNAICPGYIDTDMTARSAANVSQKTGRSVEDARQILADVNKHGRLITAQEVSETALFLASDAAASINGQIIGLTGGDI